MVLRDYRREKTYSITDSPPYPALGFFLVFCYKVKLICNLNGLRINLFSGFVTEVPTILSTSLYIPTVDWRKHKQ